MADKGFKTYAEQRALLESRGLVIAHPRIFTKAMQQDDYYNIINGYKKPFLAGSSPEKYLAKTSFEQLYALYTFDQSIRGLFLVDLLKIEKHLKSLIAYHFSERHGHDHNLYLDPANFKHASPTNRQRAKALIECIQRDMDFYARRGNASIRHYMNTYGYVPLWVLNNVLSFGRVSHFYSCMELDEQKAVSSHFGMSASMLSGFMCFLDDFRNTCAHGARIYLPNRDRKFQRLIPDTQIHRNLEIPKNSTGNFIVGKSDVLAMLICLKCFLGKTDFKQVKKRFKKFHQKMEKDIPPDILARIDKEMGLRANYLGSL